MLKLSLVKESDIIINMEDISNYEKLRDDTQLFYNSIKKVFSPALCVDVIFNAEGFNYIIFKKERSERDKKSQILRFKLIPLAKELLEKANIYQEYEETLSTFSIKKHKKKIIVTKIVKYWGIIAIFKGRKIKIIIRKVGNGNIHFWSIVPAWTTNK